MVDLTDDYLSPTQTAAALGLSEQRVRQLANEGRLTCVRTPLGRLYARAVVADYALGRGIAFPREQR